MVGIDFKPGFEAEMGQATPLVLYAAFIRDGLDRRRRAEATEAMDDGLGRWLRADGLRLRTADPESWAAAGELLTAAGAD